MPSRRPDENAPPALFEHCCRAYEAMLAEARRIPVVTGSDDESAYNIVYEGFFTRLITGKLNLSTPYYSSIRDALMNMGCIRQLRRGGSTTPSQWELIREPSLEAFMNQMPTKTPKQTKEDATQAQILALADRLSHVETTQEATTAFLAKKFGTEKADAQEA